ncbi:precorrin-2 dehydrogenase/sirohydrochlorin ferrochelatase family protein [Neobacillus dielmonensis]|uniref:precorrin-2 dehydrogenase/sirohydrochlorin ferrochelatase family protein n=1 Tax=Neobacillus dielmonensis TaxID=1347369 RepID=UPI0005A9BE69|nr:NAD(P)-dependent oxidoreductase [Neobacillus dielmonensis]
MSSYYPIMLRLEGKKVVVVGGGNVAERKIKGLLGTGAHITVISPEAGEFIQKLADEKKVTWHERSFDPADAQGADIIFAASNDSKINQLVKDVAGPRQLVTLADDPDSSDFHVPARINRGRLSIAISTGGASPTLARRIRRQLEEQFDPNYGDFLEFLFLKRKWILSHVGDQSLKSKLLTAITGPEFLDSSNREALFQKIYKEMI